MSFESLQLRPELLLTCKKQGFRDPTPIQALVIPHVMAGRDVVVESQTGSGKTLAYGLPLLNREPLQTEHLEVLVITPTRELAEQIAAELQRSSGKLSRPIVLLTGRGGLDKQKAALEAGALIAVGTIGRIEELLSRSMLRLDHLRTLVLDEVDELLRGGFSSNLAALIAGMPRERQTLLFSATVPTEVETVAKQFTRQATRLRTSAAREHPAELKHRVMFTSVDDRVKNLEGYLAAERPYQALIFCGTKNETEEVSGALADLGLEAEFLHGDLSPLKRRQLLERFRSGDLPVLVASDLAARGLDLPGVDLIVNYSLPAGSAAYLHRAGRTGRAGRAGVVLSLIIGQQHTQYERLKETFEFESMELSPRGKLFSHPARTQEERDRLFGKPPPKPLPGERAEARTEGTDQRLGKKAGQKRPSQVDANSVSKRDSKTPSKTASKTGSKFAPGSAGKSAPRSEARPPRKGSPQRRKS